MTQQYQQKQIPVQGSFFNNILKIFLPLASSAFIIALLLINFVFKTPDTLPTTAAPENQNMIAANQATQKLVSDEDITAEDIINDFDDDELNQIDQGVTLAMAN